MLYTLLSIGCGLTLPRIEQEHFPYSLSISVASAQAFLSAAASGMMSITGIVFAMAFVVVQFSAIAFSPRLVLWFARDRKIYHSLGFFIATFIYALFTLAWVDRGGSGSVPLLSSLVVACMLVTSMFLFARLVQGLNNLQISNVLRLIGDRGRQVIRDMFRSLDERAISGTVAAPGAGNTPLGPVTQALDYAGAPRTVARLDTHALAGQAERAGGLIVMKCVVGDTLVDGVAILQIHGAKSHIPEPVLRRAIDLQWERTFEQDPKYPIRLLVDIAIKALSPAINDPTTAVQTIDQIEDLLRRLGQRDLDAGCICDTRGILRLIIPMPNWHDYLQLAFDEIRQYGATSVQVMRRLRSALLGLMSSLPAGERAMAVQRYIEHLDLAVEHSPLDAEDRFAARQDDRQGLGLSRQGEQGGAAVSQVYART
jgi:uncharacterized membrane protein